MAENAIKEEKKIGFSDFPFIKTCSQAAFGASSTEKCKALSDCVI